MKTSLLLLLLLPLVQGFRPIQLEIQRAPGKELTDGNILDVVKQGLTNKEAKQFMMKLFRTNQQDSYMQKAGKGFAMKFKIEDLVKIFSKKDTKTRKNTNIKAKDFVPFMNRVQ